MNTKNIFFIIGLIAAGWYIYNEFQKPEEERSYYVMLFLVVIVILMFGFEFK